MVENGKDVVVAESKLNEAEALLESAKLNGEVIVAEIKATDPTDREAVKAIVDKVKSLKQPFRDVLSLLKETVRLMKDAV